MSTFPETNKGPVRVVFQDEARFGRMQDARRCWVPEGVRAIIKHQEVREYTYAYTALCPENGKSVSLLLPLVNSDLMNLFLEEVSRQWKEYRVVMVLDQASWHLSKELKTFDNIRLVPLPPYSPELNPVEHLWEYVREQHLGNFYWNSMDELEDRLVDIFHDLLSQTDTLRSLALYNWMIL